MDERLPIARRSLLAASMLLAPGAALAASRRIVDAGSFGARGDGTTLATRAIQAAIDDAARDGATVTLPAGRYLTGSLFVKGGVTLRIDRGVTIMGSQDIADYPMLPTRIAGIEMVWPAALLNIYRERGARIVGEGIVDGDGKVFWDSYWTLRRQYEPKGLRWAADYDCRRPRLIQVFDARDARVGGGLTLRRAGFWTLHICYSDGVTVSDVTIRNNEGGRGPSTDGIDIDSSRNVIVERADIACNDDALCIKAGRDADGLRVARPTENVVIRNCIVRDGAAGITFGSETSGGFRNIEVHDIEVLSPTPIGILFKSARTRGGLGRNILIRDMRLTGVRTVFSVNLNWNPSYSYATIPDGITDVPPYWRVLATPVPPAQGVPRLRDVTVRRITATGARRAFDVAAYPNAPLENFRFEGMKLDVQAGGTIANAKDWRFANNAISASPVVTESTGMKGL